MTKPGSPLSPAALDRDGASGVLAAREIELEILAFIERAGERTFAAGEWIGRRGVRRRIEGFSLRPHTPLSAADIEYKAFGPSGRETAWLSRGMICGAAGLAMPLTGFAVRLAPHLADRYAVEYDGAFFDGGVASASNGAACRSSRADDPLESMRIWILEVAADALKNGERAAK
jgi:hypothetical protein